MTLLWLPIALPLGGAIVLLLGGRRTDRWGHLLGCGTVLGAFAVAVAGFAELLGRAAAHRVLQGNLFTWVPVGELQASEELRQASEELSKSPASLQLRYLQTLLELGADQNSTVVFPLPVDIITPFLNAARNRTSEGR